MIQLTKIFQFETAHAIHGYTGACKNIHGHSYELHVTVAARNPGQGYIPAPGFIIDFAEIKKLVTTAIIHQFDHKLVLSEDFIGAHPAVIAEENLVIWKPEPTAENLLLFIQQTLSTLVPENVQLIRLKLYETKNSYAEWVNDNIFNTETLHH